MNAKFRNSLMGCIAVLALLGMAATPMSQPAALGTTYYIDNLQPSWTAPGGGGVYAAYYGPPSYAGVSPGMTAVFDGRQAGIIQAGINVDADTHYYDEGLFAWAPTFTIDTLAAGDLNYDVENEKGDNAVWMTIEIDTGVVDDRSDNTTFQHVPAFYGSGWHTVDAAAGLWQKWNDNNGDVTGNPLISLDDIAADAAYTGLNVVRMYLRLGIGDAYNTPDNGTIGWVDKVVIGADTYDFIVPVPTVVTPTSTDWIFVNDNGPAGFTTGYHSGPATAPLGTGSAFMTLSSASAGTILVSQKYAGTPLADIDALTYSTYSTAPTTALSFQINYDPDLTDANTPWYGRLVYEPYQNGTVVANTWQNWDMIDGGGGLWYASSNGNSNVDNTCPMASPCTWTALLAAYPNIGVRADAGAAIMFKAGSGWASFNGSVDNLSITISNDLDTYDFEPVSTVYVDDDWASTTLGTDPDGAGPAVNFGADSFATIQEGVNGVATGGTVNVAAGTYAGNVTVGKSVTIMGDPGDTTAGPGASAPLVDGGSLPGSGFFIENGTSNVTIKGFEIANFTSNDSGIGNGISAWEASTSYITIQDNYFHDLGWDAVLVGNDGALGDHTYWTIKANVMDEESPGVDSGYGFELTNASYSSIEDNIIHAVDSFSVITVLARRNESNITIKGNQIDGTINASGRAAIYMYAYDLEVADLTLDSVLIQDNVITVTGGLDIRIRDLNLVDPPETGGTMTNVQLLHNSIQSFKNDTAAPVNAEQNWWGTIVGATIDTQITGTGDAGVDYSPWCTDATCTAFVPPFTTTTAITGDASDPSVRGVGVTINFTVESDLLGAPAPVGTVDVSDGTNTICSAVALDGSGNGSCLYGFLDGGPYTLTATFNPTDTNAFSTSNDTESHTVNVLPGYTKGDYSGDLVADLTYFRPASGLWGTLRSGMDFSYGFPMWGSWGQTGDKAISGDYDGDGKQDYALRRPASGGQSMAYVILLSSTHYNLSSPLIIPAGWDGLGDTAVPGDFDGDGITEPAIWRGSTGVWIIPLSSGSFSTYRFAAWGSAGDTPVAADVDGDGQSDIGYYRPSASLWGFLLSSQSYSYAAPEFRSWGFTGTSAAMADYDGDGIADPAFVQPPASGQSAAYRLLLSTTGYDFGQAVTIPAGWPGLGDTPVPQDYDGDGKADAGIWRGNTGIWIIPLSSTNNVSYMFAAWGASGDQPLK